jgi:phosphate transport system permease protein
MRWPEQISRAIFATCAGLVIVVMASIIIFIGANAYQTFTVDHVNPLNFFFTSNWGAVYNPPQAPGQPGALTLIVGSVVVTILAVLVSTPISVGVALFITEVAPTWARQLMQPVIELLAGIPSVIYGFLGLLILVPLVADVYNFFVGFQFNQGYGVIAATLVLTIMILPTIGTIAVDTLAALPNGLREASLALGATRWQTIRRTLLPAASSGIFTGVILGMGRALGETLAVSFVIGGNFNNFPIRFLPIYPYVSVSFASTLTVQLLSDFNEATEGSLNLHAIWTLAFILLIISFLLVVASRWIASRSAFNVKDTAPRNAPRTAKRAIAQTGGAA